MSIKDKIPFSVAYSNRVGMYESRSPLYDIAELNLKHYQIQSDLDNILHISSVPLLAVFGYPNADEITTGRMKHYHYHLNQGWNMSAHRVTVMTASSQG